MPEFLSAPQSHVPISRQNKRGLAHSLVNLAQARWAKLSRAVKGIARAMFLAKEDKEAFKAESEQALSAALAGVSEVKLHVEDVRDLQKINYLHQGNAGLYTEEAVKQRHDLRTDGGLMEAVRTWWRYLPKDETAKLPQVTKPVYCAMVVIIQMVLLPRFKMKGDINYDPEEDWLDDNKGQDSMGFPDFFDAMFELADMWCESMSASDYTALLSQLLLDAKAQGNMFDMLLKKFGYVAPDVAPDVGAVESDEVATSTSDRHKAADGSHDSVKESNNSKNMKSKKAGGGAKIMEGGGGDRKGQGIQGINGKNKGRKTKIVHMGDSRDVAALANVSQSGTSRDEGEDSLGDLNSTLGFAADHGARHAMIPEEGGDSGVHIEELEASSNHPSHSGVLEQATSLRPRHSLPPLQSDNRRKDSHRNRQAPHVLRAQVREKEEDPSEFQRCVCD
ncbi:hypothetical protein CEUSTIGMA_g2001.t1 [Chlamydomonas eustigma]|uniref:Uncharacterized protein n=1 Tax=Chlamydomonas eustigma TaxID=1157962 RepID=A0A250WUR8_9CHLO|nr:hypothetical protein CEUSTIGMA_g2001.t1 [Chlamydomonas eustigma]|eukprot:GAX74551.1 hypothetical protein CEUSTIGMA_g2001.t1 [Chlamydomonas eustigma]